MARVLFKLPVRIDGTPYEAGREHELAPALVGHWYVKALVKDGQARIIDDPKPEPKPEPVAAPVAPKVEAKVEPVVKTEPVKPAVKPQPKQPQKTAARRGRR